MTGVLIGIISYYLTGIIYALILLDLSGKLANKSLTDILGMALVWPAGIYYMIFG